MRLTKLLAVASVDRATVDDAGALRNGSRDGRRKVCTDICVSLLRLCRCRDLAGADGPDGLVCDHDLAVQ